MSDVVLFRTYLYVPGSKPDVVEKAFNSDADCIVIDLEDAVHPDKKVDARNFVAEFIAAGATKPFLVRINNLESKWGKADLEAIALPGLAGIRIPKVESVDTVKQAADILNKAKSDAQIHLLIESAKGVGQLSALASSDPRVAAISLGEADLLSDLRATNDEALKFCRNALIVAARAAGLKQPSQSVYANTKDLVGLRESTVHAKETGFFGRSVIHPNQIDTVNEVFTPTQQEYEKALEILSVFEQIQKSGESVMALPNGEMIDPANIYHAQFMVKLFESNKRQREKMSNPLIQALAGPIKVIDLAQPLYAGMPISPNHPEFRLVYIRRHGDSVRADGGSAANEMIVTGGHVGTHVDALAHVSQDGVVYGNVPVEDCFQGGKFISHGIDKMNPVVTRGLLLDIAKLKGVDVLPGGYAITAEDIKAECERIGQTPQEGDAVVIRTGWGSYFSGDAKVYIGHDSGVPGIETTAAQWLADKKIVVVGCDTTAFEHIAPGKGHSVLPVHRILLVESGINIIEHMNLEEASANNLTEFMFMLSPLKIVGGTGSPVRPLAVI